MKFTLHNNKANFVCNRDETLNPRRPTVFPQSVSRSFNNEIDKPIKPYDTIAGSH